MTLEEVIDATKGRRLNEARQYLSLKEDASEGTLYVALLQHCVEEHADKADEMTNAVFKGLAKNAKSRTTAWEVLDSVLEEGGTGTLKLGKRYVEREIRRFRHVIAWRDDVIDSSRRARPGGVKCKVMDSAAAALRFAEDELLGDGSGRIQLYPFNDGQLRDKAEHRSLRNALFEANDAPGLRSYLEKYRTTMVRFGQPGRAQGTWPLLLPRVLFQELIEKLDRPALTKVLMDLGPSAGALVTAADSCVRYGREESLGVLLDALSDLTTVERFDKLLESAAKLGAAGPLRALLDSPHAPKGSGTSIPPIVIAAGFDGGNVECVKMLLEAGGDPHERVPPTARAYGGKRPIDLANGNAALVALVEQDRPPLNMSEAVKAGALERVLELLSEGQPAGAMIAASVGQAEILREIIARSEVPQEDLDKGLWYACQNGHEDIVTILMEETSANPTAKINHSTALAVGRKKGHLKLVNLIQSAQRKRKRLAKKSAKNAGK